MAQCDGECGLNKRLDLGNVPTNIVTLFRLAGILCFFFFGAVGPNRLEAAYFLKELWQVGRETGSAGS